MIPKIGAPLDRVDGRAKVTGEARYAAENSLPNIAHAVMVTSTIPSGTIRAIDTSKATGAIAILSHLNAPKLNLQSQPGQGNAFREPRAIPFADARVYYLGQPIAVVVANTLEQAMHGASLVNVTYAKSDAKTSLEANRSEAMDPSKSEFHKGDADAAFANAPVKIDHVYTTPYEHHNPMEGHAIVAAWDGDKLTLHDSSQNIFGARSTLARAFNVPQENVRVLSPFVGGAFGSKGGMWPHVLIGVMAAREVKRPVKLAVTRKQLFFAAGHRPYTSQRVALGATQDGKLVSVIHEGVSQSNDVTDYAERFTSPTRVIYASPNMRGANPIVRLNVSSPTYMRAPGESPGMFALESAMDELAYAVNIDPVQLRLANYADANLSKKSRGRASH